MSDSSIRQGGQVFDESDYVAVDGVTILGSGVTTDPLRVPPGSVSVAVDGTTILGDGTAADPLRAAPGDPNTQAYFGSTGALTDDTDATMTPTDWIQNSPGGGPQAIRVNRTVRSVAIGQGATAGGTNSFAQGLGSSASGISTHAHGLNTTATGIAAHAEGVGTGAVGDYTHAEGGQSIAQGAYAHAEGLQTIALGEASHAEGKGSVANGEASHAEGKGSVANAEGSHAEGLGTANGKFSHAEGNLSETSRDGQHAHSSGPGALAGPNSSGDTQYGRCTLAAGPTAGLVAPELLQLLLGESPGVSFALALNRAYTLIVTVVMQGTVVGVPALLSFRNMYAIQPILGVPTIVASGVPEQIADALATANAWGVTVTAGVPGLTVEVTTGIFPAIVQATAAVDWVEIRTA